jgi:hypothetical protein
MAAKAISSKNYVKSGRSVAKKAISDLDIVRALSGEQKPLSFKRYPGDFIVVILASGKKISYHPEAVRQAIKSLS